MKFHKSPQCDVPDSIIAPCFKPSLSLSDLTRCWNERRRRLKFRLTGNEHTNENTPKMKTQRDKSLGESTIRSSPNDKSLKSLVQGIDCRDQSLAVSVFMRGLDAQGRL